VKPDLKAIKARCEAATPGDQWGQKWDGTLGRGEIRIGPLGAPATARFVFSAHGFGNAGTAHPDFQLAICAAEDVPALVARVEELEAALREARARLSVRSDALSASLVVWLDAVLADADSSADPAPGRTNDGHGHVRPRPDGVLARCGGPAICRECALEAARYGAP
jgi:hypothetical protein